MKLRVAHDLDGSVAVRWAEPNAGHDLLDHSIASCRSRRGAVGLDLLPTRAGALQACQVMAGRRRWAAREVSPASSCSKDRKQTREALQYQPLSS